MHSVHLRVVLAVRVGRTHCRHVYLGTAGYYISVYIGSGYVWLVVTAGAGAAIPEDLLPVFGSGWVGFFGFSFMHPILIYLPE